MPYWQWYLVIGLVLAVPMVAILAKEIWVNLSEKATGRRRQPEPILRLPRGQGWR